jgi:hypothetical protein
LLGETVAKENLVKQGACLVPKNFQDFPSHRIFRRMHEALNINKK